MPPWKPIATLTRLEIEFRFTMALPLELVLVVLVLSVLFTKGAKLWIIDREPMYCR
jgi:hypothetical protein